MVQNGKFSAGAEALVNTLKNVDFLRKSSLRGMYRASLVAHPTLGRPTIPHLREVPKRPRRGPGPSTSFFLGGILRPPFLFDGSMDGEKKTRVLFNAHSLSNANFNPLGVVLWSNISIKAARAGFAPSSDSTRNETCVQLWPLHAYMHACEWKPAHA